MRKIQIIEIDKLNVRKKVLSIFRREYLSISFVIINSTPDIKPMINSKITGVLKIKKSLIIIRDVF
tara:strand:- start:3924 stop:4121 length:198 start_codon:yes stop_codon:yes gene_type:complete